MNESLTSKILFFKPIFFLMLFYLAVSEIAQTLLYTIVAYIVTAAGKEGTDFSNTVNEIAGQYLFVSFAIGALIVAITTHLGDKALYRQKTFWNDPRKPIWQLDRFTKEEFLRGVASGFIVAAIYLAIFSLSNQISYLGVYITSTFGTPVFPLFFMDLIALIALVLCEEFIFRHKILNFFLLRLPEGWSITLTTLLYISAKHLQFHLLNLDYLNLLCLNLTVGFFFVKSGKAHRGLGFLAALFCLIHPIAGLPLWGSESPSFLLFKNTQKASALLSGGNAGPFAGLGLFSIITVFAVGAYVSWKNSRKPVGN